MSNTPTRFTFAQCSSTFAIHVKAEDGTYYTIRLKQNDNNYKVIKENVWKFKPDQQINVETTTNQKGGPLRKEIVELTDILTGKKVQLDVQSVTEANEGIISSIEYHIEHKKEIEKLQKLLGELGLKIEVDYPYYLDDFGSITVIHKGEVVFTGKTTDLNPIGREMTRY